MKPLSGFNLKGTHSFNALLILHIFALIKNSFPRKVSIFFINISSTKKNVLAQRREFFIGFKFLCFSEFFNYWERDSKVVFLLSTAWPDVDIKSRPDFLPKVAQKVTTRVILQKDAFQIRSKRLQKLDLLL